MAPREDGLLRRAPLPDDAEAIGRMHHQAWLDSYAHLLPVGWFDEHGPQERVELWRRVLAEPASDGVRRVAVFRPDGAAVAWCIAGPAREHEGVPPVRDLELWGLYVDRSLHGSGLGQELHDWAVGDRPAQLWRAEGNARAAAFYRRNGFADDGTSSASTRHPMVEVRMVR